MYKSLKSIAKSFDISVAYIQRHYSKVLVEGKHYIYVGSMKRYNVEEMEKILITKNKSSKEKDILDKFLI